MNSKVCNDCEDNQNDEDRPKSPLFIDITNEIVY